MQFSEKPETKIGDYGEKLVNEYWDRNGYVIYKPVTNRSHTNDNFIVPPNKIGILFSDTKTKPARDVYPDTGFNWKHWNIYASLQRMHRMPCFINFVDPFCGKCYGNWLSRLSDSQSDDYREICYSRLGSMRYLFDLPDTACMEYMKLTRRKLSEECLLDLRARHLERFNDLIGCNGVYMPHSDIPPIEEIV